jgi:hypothetical protein
VESSHSIPRLKEYAFGVEAKVEAKVEALGRGDGVRLVGGA